MQYSATSNTPEVTYTYDADALWKVNNSAAAVEYRHDVLGRVTRRVQTIAGTAYISDATWRPAGLETLTLPSGRKVTYSVDTIGRVSQVKGSLNQIDTVYASSVNYAAHGPMKSWNVGASGSEAWTWNQRLQPKTIKHGSALDLELYYCANDAASCAANQGSPVKQSLKHLGTTLQYTYTAMDQVASVEEKTAAASCWKRGFGYGQTGNQWVSSATTFTTSSFTPTSSSNFDNKNQLGIQGSSYDASGNQTKIGGFGFQWDAEGRLRSSTLNGLVTTYSYDGEGHRVRKWTGSNDGPMTYVYDAAGQMAAEYGEGQAVGTQYIAVDWLGSVRALTNGVTANERHDYEPFGEELPTGLCGRGPGNYYSGGDSLMRFTGKERDTETGLDYFETRYLSSAQGRFTSPDKFPWWNLQHSEKDEEKKQFADYIGNPQNWNMYTYVLNNPLNHTDPTGMLFIDPTGNDCVYVNSGGTGVGSINNEVNSSQCGKTNGYWVDGTVTQARFAYGSLILSGTTNGEDRTSASYGLGPNLGLLALREAGDRASRDLSTSAIIMGGTAAAIIATYAAPAVLTALTSIELGAVGANLLPPAARKILGTLVPLAAKTVAKAITERGRGGSQVNRVATWLQQMTLGEVAKLAAKGDPEAITAVKIVKDAARLAQK